jgi:putative membrane protein insertion efficiency factor
VRDEVSSRLAGGLLVAAIRAYQWTFSPWLGPACRFEPTCSQYAIEAVQRHGPIRGSWLAAKRLARCHPLGDHGYDPLV